MHTETSSRVQQKLPWADYNSATAWPLLPAIVILGIYLFIAPTHAKQSLDCLSWLLAGGVILGLSCIAGLYLQLRRWDVHSVALLPYALLAVFAVCTWYAASHQAVALRPEVAAWPAYAASTMLGVALAGLLAYGVQLRSGHPVTDARGYYVTWQEDRQTAAVGPQQAAAGEGTGSQAKRIANPAEPAKFDFGRLYGFSDLKGELRDAAKAWKDQGKNGILLFGEPGTGKSAMAEALAGELGLPIIVTTFGSMTSKWVGESTERMMQVFGDALAQQPCVLFIDEIDALIGDRETGSRAGGPEEYQRIVGAFLERAVALRDTGVLLIGATNYVDRLDPAAIREGRFDFKLEVPLPDAAARESLIRVRLLEKRCTSDAQTIKRLVQRWAGFNVPRILNATESACVIAQEAGRAQSMQFSDFLAGLRKVQGRKAGPPEGAKDLNALHMDPEMAERLGLLATQFRRIDEIEELGGSIPKGLVFYGPPGTGKTATAMAMAKACGWTFLERTGRSLLEPGAIAALRRQASDLRPAIVFIDEADDILGVRAFSGHKALTNELLTLIDGAGGALQDVVWIAATNDMDSMDSAALRGGRFEQKIGFKPPGEEAMLHLVLDWAQTHRDAIDGDPIRWAAQVAAGMHGLAPADAHAILRVANNLALGQHLMHGVSRHVDAQHIAVAMNEIVRGNTAM